MKRLDQAKAALEQKKPETALGHLVAAWRERPLAELGELVERFEVAFPPAPFEGSAKDFVAAAKKPSVTTLGALAKAAVAPKTAETIDRLDALAPHRDDPRVASALLSLIRDVPWTSDGARPVFVRTFELLVKIADPRLLMLAPSLPTGWKFRENQREWMARQLERAVEAVATARAKKPLEPLSAAEHSVVKALAAALTPKAKPTSSGASKEQLLAEVYARPDDDGPRLVLADFLLERGDPQGEFITLQFKADKSKEEKAREAALKTKHGKSWLGPLATVVLKDVEFRRGFPSKVVAKFKSQREAEQYGDDPAWATVEDLAWSQSGSWTEDAGRWHEYFPKHARPKTCVVGRFGVERLLEAKGPWPFESLTLQTRNVEVQQRLAESKAFPHVRQLRVGDSFAPQVLASSWLAAVPDLRVFAEGGQYSGKARDFAPYLDALAARERLVFESTWTGTVEFSRGDDGRLSKVRVSGATGNQTKSLFSRLSPGLRGRVTSVSSEGLPADVATQFLGLVGSSAAEAPQERERVRFVAATWHQTGWIVVRAHALVLTDAAGKVRSELPINETTVAAFSPDRALVACGFQRRLEWRNTTTGKLVATDRLESPVCRVCFSRGGRFVLVHTEQQLEVRTWPERALRWTVKNGTYPKTAAAAGVTDDGETVVAAMFNEELRVSRVAEKRPTTVALGSYSPSLVFVGPSTFVVSSRAGSLRQFELGDLEQPAKSWSLPESRRLFASADGRRLLAGPEEAYVKPQPNHVVNLETGQVSTLEGSFKALAFSDDGRQLLGSDGFGLVVRDVSS